MVLHNLDWDRMRGVIWYQGESNAGDATAARQYVAKQRTLVQSWRRPDGRAQRRTRTHS